MTSQALEMTSFRNNHGIGNFVTLSSSSSYFCPHFKIPSNIPQISQFVAHAIKVKAATTPASSLHSPNCSPSNSLGRRQLMYMSTIPFIVPAGIDISPPGDLLHVKEEIRNVLTKGKAAGVLRLVFHDAGTFDFIEKTGGMNGSIVYELDRPENKGLKKSVKILEKAKTQIEMQCPVSWADVIAMAGAEAVSVCEGPTISVRLGRTDSLVPDPEGKLPEESLDAPALKQCFQNKGFSVQELVALSGAHTLGGKGFGNPSVFDNSYFKILLEKPWLSSAGMSSMIGLPSDRALADDEECLRWISKYADNQELFFEDFKNAYIKLVNTGAKWRTI